MAKRDKITTDGSALSSNPFAGLSAHLADAPEGAPVAEAPTATPETTTVALSGRIIVRRQKKGQGGKTATFVEGIAAAAAAELLSALKRELGCSGRLEGGTLIAGTSEHQRVAQWLRDRGAARVDVGN